MAAVGADDVDALLGQVGVQLVYLLLGDVDLLERCRDLVERQVAVLLAVGDQPPQLVELVGRGAIGKQNLVVDPSALLVGASPARREIRLDPTAVRLVWM